MKHVYQGSANRNYLIQVNIFLNIIYIIIDIVRFLRIEDGGLTYILFKKVIINDGGLYMI